MNTIHSTAIIAKNVQLGQNVIIHPYVVIEAGVEIGDNVEIFPGAYLGKPPKGAGALARQPVYQPVIHIGDNCSIGPHSVIYYDVSIGSNTLIGDGVSIREQVEIGNFCVIGRQVTINYNTKIGHHTKIMDLTHITGNMIIGDNVFISMSVTTANDNAIAYSREYTDKQIKGPHIEDGATIGLGATLLPNIVVHKGALVAAGAVVTKDVPERTVVMGIPAVIKHKVLGTCF
ncbi:MAG: acyltransferase [Gammaproteobacteria bacterium]